MRAKVTRFVAALALGICVAPALALPPFSVQWKAKYVEGNKDDKFVKAVATVNCNVCHDPKTKSKKDHNDYGKAVKKFLSKADYDKIKGDTEAAKKYIQEGIDKAAAEKAPDGKTYGDRIKAGILPSAG